LSRKSYAGKGKQISSSIRWSIELVKRILKTRKRRGRLSFLSR
jgi:hypothetical protein